MILRERWPRRPRRPSADHGPAPTATDINAIEAVAQKIYGWNRNHAAWCAVIAVLLMILASALVPRHGLWAAGLFVLAVPFLIRWKNHARKMREMLQLNSALLTIRWNKSMVLLNRLLLHMLDLYEPSPWPGKLRGLFKRNRS